MSVMRDPLATPSRLLGVMKYVANRDGRAERKDVLRSMLAPASLGDQEHPDSAKFAVITVAPKLTETGEIDNDADFSGVWTDPNGNQFTIKQTGNKIVGSTSRRATRIDPLTALRFE